MTYKMKIIYRHMYKDVYWIGFMNIRPYARVERKIITVVKMYIRLVVDHFTRT